MVCLWIEDPWPLFYLEIKNEKWKKILKHQLSINSEVYQESLSVNCSRRLSVVRLSSLKIRLVLISSSAIANHDVYRPPSFIWRLAASPLVARVLGFSCSNFRNKNKRLLAVYNHSDISLNDNDHPREGGGGLNKCLHEEAPPRGQTSYLLHIIFHDKGTPLVYLLLTNGTPLSHIKLKTRLIGHTLFTTLHSF